MLGTCHVPPWPKAFSPGFIVTFSCKDAQSCCSPLLWWTGSWLHRGLCLLLVMAKGAKAGFVHSCRAGLGSSRSAGCANPDACWWNGGNGAELQELSLASLAELHSRRGGSSPEMAHLSSQVLPSSLKHQTLFLWNFSAHGTFSVAEGRREEVILTI